MFCLRVLTPHGTSCLLGRPAGPLLPYQGDGSWGCCRKPLQPERSGEVTGLSTRFLNARAGPCLGKAFPGKHIFPKPGRAEERLGHNSSLRRELY